MTGYDTQLAPAPQSEFGAGNPTHRASLTRLTARLAADNRDRRRQGRRDAPLAARNGGSGLRMSGPPGGRSLPGAQAVAGTGPPSRGEQLSAAQALIAEARQRQRDRRRRAVGLTVAAALSAAAFVAGASGLAGRGIRTPGEGPGWPPAGPVGPMPSQVVVWTGSFKVQVLSSRTGRVIRTVASNVGLYQGGVPAIAVSSAGVVYFDTARGGEQWIESTPVTGGPITIVGPGDMPAISPNGRLLAYLAYTINIYPPNTPVRDMKPAPDAIVVKNLDTGVVRRWAFTSDVPAITSLSWSRDNRFLAYTSLSWASGLQPPADTTQMLDTRSAGTLTSRRRISLAVGLGWAGFLTPQVGLAVTPYPAAQGRQQSLVAVDTRTGRILRRLIQLPRQGLSSANAFDGTEGSITADPSGRYLLIATNGPRGYGEILRWAIGERHLAELATGAIRAAWA